VERTAEESFPGYLRFSVVRFTDSVSHSCHPSDKSLGYYHSSAHADWALNTLSANPSLSYGLQPRVAATLPWVSNSNPPQPQWVCVLFQFAPTQRSRGGNVGLEVETASR